MGKPQSQPLTGRASELLQLMEHVIWIEAQLRRQHPGSLTQGQECLCVSSVGGGELRQLFVKGRHTGRLAG